MKQSKLKLIQMFLMVFAVFFLGSVYSYADWQIDISKFRDDICRTQYYSRLCNSPDKVGSFATQGECEKGRYEYCGGRGDLFCMNRIRCIGYDRPVSSQTPSRPEAEEIAPDGYDCYNLLANWKQSPNMNNYDCSCPGGAKGIVVCVAKSPTYPLSIPPLPFTKQSEPETTKRTTSELPLRLKDGAGGYATATSESKLKPGLSSISGSSKLQIAEQARNIKSIADLACVAQWSILAAQTAAVGNLEKAREEAGYRFDDWKRELGCKMINVYVPEVPTPMEENPQYKAYKYIVERIDKIYPEMISTHVKLDVVRDVRSEVIRKQRELKVKETLSKNVEEKNKLKEEEKSLEEQAKELLKEASEMESKAKTYQEEVKNLYQEYDKISMNPRYASEFIKNIGKNTK